VIGDGSAPIRLRVLGGHFACVRLAAGAPPPAWGPQGELWSVTRRGDELSLVCPEAVVPDDVSQVQRGFHALEVLGPLEFDAVGVLAALCAPLAAAGIPLLTLSTYDTDVVLVRDLAGAVSALEGAGHEVGRLEVDGVAGAGGDDEPAAPGAGDR